jgi:hypothetical protein
MRRRLTGYRTIRLDVAQLLLDALHRDIIAFGRRQRCLQFGEVLCWQLQGQVADAILMRLDLSACDFEEIRLPTLSARGDRPLDWISSIKELT